jgi:hypothetical protein
MTLERPINDIEKQILDALTDVKFGSVEIVIHDSKIVQMQKNEKIRFDKN